MTLNTNDHIMLYNAINNFEHKFDKMIDELGRLNTNMEKLIELNSPELIHKVMWTDYDNQNLTNCYEKSIPYWVNPIT